MSDPQPTPNLARSFGRWIDSVLWNPTQLAYLMIVLIGSAMAIRVFNSLIIGIASPRAMLEGNAEGKLRIASSFESIAAGLTTLGLIAAGLTAVSMILMSIERGRTHED